MKTMNFNVNQSQQKETQMTINKNAPVECYQFEVNKKPKAELVYPQLDKKYLVDGLFPLKEVSMLVDGGEAYIEEMLTDLSYKVIAANDQKTVFGPMAKVHGDVLMFTGYSCEPQWSGDPVVTINDKNKGERSGKLKVVHGVTEAPMPPLFHQAEAGSDYTVSDAFKTLKSYIQEATNLKLIVFSLDQKHFMSPSLSKCPTGRKHIVEHFKKIAEETGAAVILTAFIDEADCFESHDFDIIETKLICQYGPIHEIDNVYAVWRPSETQQRESCERCDLPYVKDRTYFGARIKGSSYQGKQLVHLYQSCSDTGMCENQTYGTKRGAL